MQKVRVLLTLKRQKLSHEDAKKYKGKRVFRSLTEALICELKFRPPKPSMS
jgi:hypothetical protein